MFSSHSVFRCFVWISEHTAIISLYSSNWMILVMKIASVFCEVRSEVLKYYLDVLLASKDYSVDITKERKKIQHTWYTDTSDCKSILLMRSSANFASSKLVLGTGFGSGHGEMFLNLGIQYIIRQYFRTGWPRLPKMLISIFSISGSGITP